MFYKLVATHRSGRKIEYFVYADDAVQAYKDAMQWAEELIRNPKAISVSIVEE